MMSAMMPTMMIDELQKSYREKRPAIRARLDDFASVWREGDDVRLFEELVFCIFTAGASARMGLNSIERVRPHLLKGNHRKLTSALSGTHRYPVARAGYIIHTRNYLHRDCGLRFSERLESFGQDREARRDFFAANA